jgi:hypothetical protein
VYGRNIREDIKDGSNEEQYYPDYYFIYALKSRDSLLLGKDGEQCLLSTSSCNLVLSLILLLCHECGIESVYYLATT